ncbi:MAG: GreA/GreB family elongation factor [Burkholderiaceae bacterium]
MKPQVNERLLTELDHVRLSKLLERDPGLAGSATDRESLAELLDFADLVPSPQIPADIVTMGSTIVLRDADGEAPRQVRLGYPGDPPTDIPKLSVLSRAGWALLGLRVGDVASWQTPTGEWRSARIEALTYQPEANGDYTG